MRFGLLLIIALSAAGCASPAPSGLPPVEHAYADSPASSLVFEPPIAFNEPRIDLGREDRQPSVFMGYEDSLPTWFYVRVSEYQSTFGPDHYHRWTSWGKASVGYR